MRTLLLLLLVACATESPRSGTAYVAEAAEIPQPTHVDMVAPTGMPLPTGAPAATGTPLPSGLTVAPFSFSTWDPPAKGLWIWRFDYIGKTPQQVAAIARAAGVGYVLIKAGQDGNFWSQAYTADAVKAFTDQGMHVLAWFYVTPNAIAETIPAVALAAAVPGTDGVILDVEAPWESDAQRQSKAIQLCDGIRAAKPNIWLGFCASGYPHRHPKFPYAEFDQHCGDAFFPMVYWYDHGEQWEAGYTEATSHMDALNMRAPRWVVQSNDDDSDGVPPSIADLNAFFERAGPRTSLWVFPNKNHEDKVSSLRDLDWAN